MPEGQQNINSSEEARETARVDKRWRDRSVENGEKQDDSLDAKRSDQIAERKETDAAVEHEADKVAADMNDSELEAIILEEHQETFPLNEQMENAMVSNSPAYEEIAERENRLKIRNMRFQKILEERKKGQQK